MRDIKFRAWDGINMHVYKWEKYVIQFNGIIGLFNKKSRSYDQVKWELMQYTGLKDKNGKEIYEGDIVEIDGKLFKDVKPRLSKMMWNESCYGWRLSLQSEIMIKSKHLEIVGNIHENPELL